MVRHSFPRISITFLWWLSSSSLLVARAVSAVLTDFLNCFVASASFLRRSWEDLVWSLVVEASRQEGMRKSMILIDPQTST